MRSPSVYTASAVQTGAPSSETSDPEGTGQQARTMTTQRRPI